MSIPRLIASLALLLPLAATPTLAAGPAAPVETRAPSGAVLTADLRDEYLAGFAILVSVTVRNDGKEPLTFPDLAARPHLVHFLLDGPKGRSERHTTPPEKEPTNTWTILPGSERNVLLEVPSSAGFTPGAWKLGVQVLDPAGAVEIAARDIRIAPPRPVAGEVVWESTISTTAGAMLPWLHEATRGFDLYLMQFTPKSPDRVQAQYFLTHLDQRVQPILARARPAEARSRHVYWLTDGSTLTIARLDGPRLRSALRTVRIPYPKAELLDRGVSDGRGGLAVPVWIPAPSGSSGHVKIFTVDDRGKTSIRAVATAARKPTIVSTSIDAASNLLLAVGDADGVVLYRSTTDAPPELPASGARVWKTEGGWAARAITFDTLPETPEHPGGLACQVLLSRPDGADGVASRTLWADLAGRVFSDRPSGAWTLPGDLQILLSGGYGAWYGVSRDATGAWWYGAQSRPVVQLPPGTPGALWPKKDQVILRSLGGPLVVSDVIAGPVQP